MAHDRAFEGTPGRSGWTLIIIAVLSVLTGLLGIVLAILG